MPVYMLKNHYGVAVVGAKNPDEALKMIRTHEDQSHNGTFVALGHKAQDLVEVTPDANGMLAYFRND